MFLTHGRVEMDNNIVENAIRLLTLNRENAPFTGHPASDIDQLLPCIFCAGHKMKSTQCSDTAYV